MSVMLVVFSTALFYLMKQNSDLSEKVMAMRGEYRRMKSSTTDMEVQMQQLSQENIELKNGGASASPKGRSATCRQMFEAAMTKEYDVVDNLKYQIQVEPSLSKFENGRFFRKFLSQNKPVLVKKGCTGLPAYSKWTHEHLSATAGSTPVKPQVSNSGVFEGSMTSTLDMTLEEYLSKMQTAAGSSLYLAEQAVPDSLKADVTVPKFASFLDLQAIRAWVGKGVLASALKSESVESIMCQLAGSKEVFLISPFETSLVYPEAEHPTYSSIVDIKNVDLSKFPKFSRAHVMNISMEAGDLLFVPSYWWFTSYNKDQYHNAIKFWFRAHSNVAKMAMEWYEDLLQEEEENAAEGGNGSSNDDVDNDIDEDDKKFVDEEMADDKADEAMDSDDDDDDDDDVKEKDDLDEVDVGKEATKQPSQNIDNNNDIIQNSLQA